MPNGIPEYNLKEKFLQMEEEEKLFSLHMADGTYYWDIVRVQVYQMLCEKHFSIDPQLMSASSFLAKAKDLVKPAINLLTRFYLAKRAPKYIFITTQRIRQGSSLVDVNSDHLYDLVCESSVAVELLNKAVISYRDIIIGRKTRVPPVLVRSLHKPKDLTHIDKKISAVLHKHFGVFFDVSCLVLDRISTFINNKNYYLKLFAKHRPNVVIFSDNGTLDGLLFAANEMQIATIELQHGCSSSNTLTWSYPQSIEGSHPGLFLPSVYLTYSEYWNGNTHYPVSWTHSIGNDYLYQESIAGNDDGVLMVSAYMYHESLFNLALELASLAEEKTIYYKLHPHQFMQKSEIRAACNGKKNILIVCDEMDLSDLFKFCNYVVAIHSTFSYVALQAGKKVCLYKRYNYFYHDDIYEYVELFDNIAELRDILDNPSKKYFHKLNNVPTFFQPFNAQRFLQLLENINQYI